MNTTQVIGVILAICTVLAAFGSLYWLWWLSGRFDKLWKQIDQMQHPLTDIIGNVPIKKRDRRNKKRNGQSR